MAAIAAAGAAGGFLTGVAALITALRRSDQAVPLPEPRPAPDPPAAAPEITPDPGPFSSGSPVPRRVPASWPLCLGMASWLLASVLVALTAVTSTAPTTLTWAAITLAALAISASALSLRTAITDYSRLGYLLRVGAGLVTSTGALISTLILTTH
jgi:hypothetical protein